MIKHLLTPICSRTLLALSVFAIAISSSDCQAQLRLLGGRRNSEPAEESPYPGYDNWELKTVVSARPPIAPRLPATSDFQPNFIIHADPSRMLSQMQRRNRDQMPVNDTILETDIRGNSNSDTLTVPRLMPSNRGIEIELQLRTRAFSRTTGTNRAATARSHATTNIAGSKKILLTPASFQTTKARTVAETNSNIVDFHWGRRIGQNIARETADDQKSTVEYISATKASAQARRQFDSTVDQSVRQLQRQFRDQVRQLKSQDRYPDHLRLRSTYDRVVAEGWFDTGEQTLNSMALPPAPVRLQRDQAVVHIHESLVNHLVRQQIAEQKFDELKEEDWSERMADILPVQDGALEVADDDRKWSLKMSKEMPFDMRLENGEVSITMNVDNFTVGERDFPGMKIQAKYALEINGSKITAKRSDKLKLTPTAAESKTDATGKKKRVGVRQQIFRSMVRKRFNPIFAESVDASRFLEQIPQQAGQLDIRLTNLEYTNGWFIGTAGLSQKNGLNGGAVSSW